MNMIHRSSESWSLTDSSGFAASWLGLYSEGKGQGGVVHDTLLKQAFPPPLALYPVWRAGGSHHQNHSYEAAGKGDNLEKVRIKSIITSPRFIFIDKNDNILAHVFYCQAEWLFDWLWLCEKLAFLRGLFTRQNCQIIIQVLRLFPCRQHVHW